MSPPKLSCGISIKQKKNCLPRQFFFCCLTMQNNGSIIFEKYLKMKAEVEFMDGGSCSVNTDNVRLCMKKATGRPCSALV